MNPDSAEPVSPAFDDNGPRPRWRLALIVAAVCCVVIAGIAIGLVVGTGGDGADPAASAANRAQSEELPTLALPGGCDLLTPGQASALVPGAPSEIGRGPDVIRGSTESACTWRNTKTDPTDPRVKPAYLEVKATAAVDEGGARALMDISLPCHNANSAQVTVASADQACLNHKSLDGHDRPDVSTVSARDGALVVEVSYQRSNWPTWRVDDQAQVTAAALIGEIVQRQ